MTKDISKWQAASRKLNDLRFQLEDILDSNFTDEEKQSIRYKQLVESVEDNLDYAIFHATGKPNQKKKKFSWLSWQTLFLLLGSPAVVEIIKLLWAFFAGG